MSFRTIDEKIVSAASMTAHADKLRRTGKRIITTNGCFDLLHWGHLSYLHKARAKGDILWVGLNSDRSVRALKGKSRPILDETTRAKQLAALESVDFVSVFDEDTPVEWLRVVRPHIHVKGGDYEGKDIPESGLVEEWGGRFETVAMEKGYSTTDLIEKLSKMLGDEK
jgi:rfaE bifunctional protein nucleotidyltransferase chain/domain